MPHIFTKKVITASTILTINIETRIIPIESKYDELCGYASASDLHKTDSPKRPSNPTKEKSAMPRWAIDLAAKAITTFTSLNFPCMLKGLMGINLPHPKL